MRKKHKFPSGPVSRRQFLHGAGGFALAIPFLPSLLTREALAAVTGPRRFIFINKGHGGIIPFFLYPNQNNTNNNGGPSISEYSSSRTAVAMTASQPSPLGHQVRKGALSSSHLYTANGKTGISPVLSASGSALSAALLAKMHLYQGLDIPTYLAHNRGCLGNFGHNDDPNAVKTQIPSIDQILAFSSKVYASGSNYKLRSITTGDYSNVFQYTNTAAFSSSTVSGGSINQVPAATNALNLFNSLFSGFTGGGGSTPAPAPTTPPDKLVVDRVLASWQSLRNGAFGSARRLSLDDRDRVDGFMENIYELQRKVNMAAGTTTAPPATSSSCSKPSTPGGSVENHPYQTTAQIVANQRIINQVLAAALACDLTRVIVIGSNHDWFDYSGDSHQEVYHAGSSATAQGYIVRGNQTMFENLPLHLASLLNSYSEGSGTVLDNSLIAWGQESGPETHDNDSSPIIAFGGLGGAFNTGAYYDYRNMSAGASKGQSYRRPGIHYSQFLVSVLRGMGLAEADYKRINLNRNGYGDPRNDAAYIYPLPSYAINEMGSILPLAANAV